MGFFASLGFRRRFHRHRFYGGMTLAAFLAAPAAATPAAGAEQSVGSIFVSTLPAGVDVWIDGTYVGRSPALAGALAVGKHSVTLTKTGWIVRELQIEVKPETTTLSAVELTPKPPRAGAARATGSYVVRGLPKGAKVLVDGLPPSSDPRVGVAAATGLHRVVLVLPRGRTTRSFEIFPDTTTEVVLHAPDATAPVSAVVAPASDYLPPGVYAVEGTKIVVRYLGHVVVARFGENGVRYDGTLVSYAGAPESIGGKLYLPLELLQRLRSEPKPEPDPSRTR
jgi:hypothetical protein